MQKAKWVILFAVVLVLGLALNSALQSGKEEFEQSILESARNLVNEQNLFDKNILSHQIGMEIKRNEFPKTYQFVVEGDSISTKVQYSIEDSSQEYMNKLMGQYRPDYGAFVAVDATSGKILSMVSYSKLKPEIDNLALRATFPAASIFKVVTASAAIDLNKAEPDTVVPFNGAYHTLYKKNVHETKTNRWTRYMTLKDAFARSVNVFFGKLGLFYVGPEELNAYAEKFLFNRPIESDIPVQTGIAKIVADDPWSVVTAASGFTRENTMSPLQGAMIAAAVANDGVMMEPFLIDSLEDQKGDMLYKSEPRTLSVVMQPESAKELRELFRQTVRVGTSRKSFRKTIRRQLFDDIEFGGKTGSLTGNSPEGKCDWFVGYGRYRDQRIAVAALTVNEKKWKVKSSTLANLYLTRHFRELKEQGKLAQLFDKQ